MLKIIIINCGIINYIPLPTSLTLFWESPPRQASSPPQKPSPRVRVRVGFLAR
jgi:hypothetical protein